MESIPIESIPFEYLPIKLPKSHFFKVNVDIVEPGSSVLISKQFKIVLIFIIINYKLYEKYDFLLVSRHSGCTFTEVCSIFLGMSWAFVGHVH